MKRIVYFLLCAAFILFCIFNASAQSVGIGTLSPNTSALLDISSNNKGMLIPRMTQAEVNGITTPAQGLLVFNTGTNSFQFYNGTGWNNVAHSGLITGAANRIPKFNGPWGLSGGLMSDNNAGVSINNTATAADPSAILDLTSTDKGILVPRMTTAQRTAIVTPATGLLVFDTNTMGFWFFNGNWTEITGSGSSQWLNNGSDIYYSVSGGNVGIGTANPEYKLDVGSSAKVRAHLFVDGYVGVGTETPPYKVTVENGSIAIHNSSDSKYWIMNYSAISNAFNITEGAESRLTITNGGNVGIGNTAPDQKLDVVGTAAISGSLTVNNNKGVMYNLQSATNLKHYTRAVSFSVINLAPGGISPEGTIGLIGGFNSAPQVYVGNMTLNGGSAGQLYSLGLIVYNVSTTSAQCRVINFSNTTITQDVIWNIMCIGQ